MRSEIGLRPTAAPTAREALGVQTFDAMLRYVVTDPDGYRWVLATFKKLVPFAQG